MRVEYRILYSFIYTTYAWLSTAHCTLPVGAGEEVVRTRLLWEEMFPEEPYHYQPEELGSSTEVFPPTSFSYDIVEACERQKSFFYQVR